MTTISEIHMGIFRSWNWDNYFLWLRWVWHSAPDCWEWLLLDTSYWETLQRITREITPWTISRSKVSALTFSPGEDSSNTSAHFTCFWKKKEENLSGYEKHLCTGSSMYYWHSIQINSLKNNSKTCQLSEYRKWPPAPKCSKIQCCTDLCQSTNLQKYIMND
jgi:hypothetical protein